MADADDWGPAWALPGYPQLPRLMTDAKTAKKRRHREFIVTEDLLNAPVQLARLIGGGGAARAAAAAAAAARQGLRGPGPPRRRGRGSRAPPAGGRRAGDAGEPASAAAAAAAAAQHDGGAGEPKKKKKRKDKRKAGEQQQAHDKQDKQQQQHEEGGEEQQRQSKKHKQRHAQEQRQRPGSGGSPPPKASKREAEQQREGGEQQEGGAGGGKKSRNKFKQAAFLQQQAAVAAAAGQQQRQQQPGLAATAPATQQPTKQQPAKQQPAKQQQQPQEAALGKKQPKRALAVQQDAAAEQRPGEQPQAAAKGGGGGGSKLLASFAARLAGSRFRQLNEALYTQPGGESYAMLQAEPGLFAAYHEGFQTQVKAWPAQPLDAAIAWLAGKPAEWVVADFGCGDARLAASVRQRVHSLDLVATAPGVVACNMAATPLAPGSVTAAVFSLALMGLDYGDFLAEAARVLAPGGWLWIAEVRSRFVGAGGGEDFAPFLAALGALGFKLVKQDARNRMFVVWVLKKEKRGAAAAGPIAWPPLKACQYKRR
ncbi:ribosomal RNA-processing protein 8 [Scenedesmus sp. PABB004]|nr:ribosomal RNA-processing protein 8 [Scenedesmus sp. PABB004]